jgi:hypothetical protein
MKLVDFGANGPTGLEVCRQALATGHRVTAVVRRPDDFLLRDKALTVAQAQVMGGLSLAPVIGDADAVLSTLGTAYSRHEIRLYSSFGRLVQSPIEHGLQIGQPCQRTVVDELIVHHGIAHIGQIQHRLRSLCPRRTLQFPCNLGQQLRQITRAQKSQQRIHVYGHTFRLAARTPVDGARVRVFADARHRVLLQRAADQQGGTIGLLSAQIGCHKIARRVFKIVDQAIGFEVECGHIGDEIIDRAR